MIGRPTISSMVRKILISFLIILLASCKSPHSEEQTKKDNVLKDYIKKPIDQANSIKAEVEKRQKRELEQLDEE